MFDLRLPDGAAVSAPPLALIPAAIPLWTITRETRGAAVRKRKHKPAVRAMPALGKACGKLRRSAPKDTDLRV